MYCRQPPRIGLFLCILFLCLAGRGVAGPMHAEENRLLLPVYRLLAVHAPKIGVSGLLFPPDRPLQVTLNNLKPGSENWVGIFPAGAASAVGNEVGWAWTGNIRAGTITVPLYNDIPNGQYEARLFYDNSLEMETKCSFMLWRSTRLDRPVYADDGGLPELTGDWYGALGELQVERLTTPSPWPGYAADSEMNVDLYIPAGLTTSRPTVFFISGYGNYHSEKYYSLLYFIASQGFNCVFIPHRYTEPDTNPDILLRILDGVTDRFSLLIDTARVGYAGHSEGGGLIYYLARERPAWGTKGRFLFSLAAWWGFHLPTTGTVDYPANTNLLVQVNRDDPGTDPRQNIDFLLHNNIPAERKSYLYLPGDAAHTADHDVSYSEVLATGYGFDALEQVGLYRPLESLMRYSFEGDTTWKSIGLPDQGDTNYDTLYTVNGITVLSTDDPLGNSHIPIPQESALDSRFLCSKDGNPRWRMCMPCRDSPRDQAWSQCQ